MSLADINDEIILSEDELSKSFEYYKDEFDIPDASVIIIEKDYIFDNSGKVFYGVGDIDDDSELIEL